jgi:DNA ligase-1
MPLKPMLAKEPNWSKVSFPLIVQPKLDGIRATVQRDDAGRIRVYSRTLKLIPNAEIQAALGKPEFVGLDGEIIVGEPTAEDCYRQTSSFAMSGSKRGADWTFYVFDIITNDVLSAGQRDQGLAHRVKSLRNDLGATFIQKVASVTCDSMAELERVEAHMVGLGFEGAIARVPGARYKYGRSTPSGPLLKIKRFTDFEAVVLNVFEENHNANEAKTNELGRTARSSAQAGKVGKGSLGGLIVSPVDDSVFPSTITFRVGTGFDARTRQELWVFDHDDKAECVGRTAKIKCFMVGVKDKPRHPVFLGWRDLEIDG